MFEYRLAYRFSNGDIEGFIGTNFTEKAARENAIDQIYKKIAWINDLGTTKEQFSDNRIITSFDGLTKEEKEIIRNHWNSNVKY